MGNFYIEPPGYPISSVGGYRLFWKSPFILRDFFLSDGYWKEWYNASQCSITCGTGGIVQQKRDCQPPTGFGVENCVGSDTQTVPCNYNIPCLGKNIYFFKLLCSVI